MRNESEAYIMNVSITVQGIAKVCRGDFPVGKISRPISNVKRKNLDLK